MAHVTKLIKYEGDNTVFIWKHPEEDFYSSTQLVVHESQEAIFFMNGQALDLFGAGRYTLETQNIPEVSRLLKRQSGDTTPFHCEVYFVNKTEQMAIRWGTDTKVQYMEPTYNFPIEIGASGEMSLRAEDSRKLLLKIVGTEDGISQQSLTSLFRGLITSKVKNYLANFMSENSVSIFEADRHLDTFSASLKAMLIKDFADYGVALEKFVVTSIVRPEGDRRYEKFKEIYFRQFADIADAKLRQQVALIDQQTKSQSIVLEAEALAKKRSLEGYSYQDERGFDVAMQFAKNDSVAQFSNLGTAVGTMTGTGVVLGGMVGNLMGDAVKKAAGTNENNSSVQSEAKITKCTSCGSVLKEGVKFCSECGAKIEKEKEEDNEIICPTCGKKTRKGKFCSECGAQLIRKCPYCGKELLSGEKFCPDCGKKI
ncbi:MAG: SPFH domain-containing protein [Synergistaceae bacterium]|nr:SPFH domain-containing protein [Synergistaceae bacterium]